jgi:ribonuclease Z
MKLLYFYLFAALSTVAPLSLSAQTSAAPTPQQEARTRIVMLGTGNPYPNPERSGPATAIVVDSTAYLVDIGAGVIRRWNAALSAGLGPLPIWALRTAFVTHLHSDHTLGYAELILDSWRTSGGTASALRVFGPVGLEAMTQHILAAYAEDIRIRTGPGGGLEGRPAPQVQVREIVEGVVYEDSLVMVTAFRVKHGAWAHAFGYRFQTPDMTIVISGDAAPPSVVPDFCQQCDVLIHEAALPEGPGVTPYYRNYHTTAEELAAIANRTQPKLLVVYHHRPGDIPGRVLQVIRSLYSGRVVSAIDGDVYQ